MVNYPCCVNASVTIRAYGRPRTRQFFHHGDSKTPKQDQGPKTIIERLSGMVQGPWLWAIVPIPMLAAYWFGGEIGLVGAAVMVPALIGLLAQQTTQSAKTLLNRSVDGLTGLPLRVDLVSALDALLKERTSTGLSTACLIVDIDEFKDISERHGHSASQTVIRAAADRLRDVMRDADIISRLDGATFALMLAPVRAVDLESVIQISSRIQAMIGEPIKVDALNLYVSSSIGFCLTSRTPAHSGEKMLAAAESAMVEARRNGPGAIRSYSKEMRQKIDAHHGLVEDARVALELEQITAWCQPQISTDTGAITGF